MRGSIAPDWRPLADIEVFGFDGSPNRVQMLVDTGFNRYLTLQRAKADALNLPLVDSSKVTLADGSEIEVEVRRVVVTWNGQRRMVGAYITEGDPSIGMAMLQNCRLQIDVTLGGRVTAESLYP